MKQSTEDTIEIIAYIFFTVAIVVGFVCSVIHDKRQDKKYGKIQYEFVVTDKYEDIGSTFHLVGGRASEQKYHVVYKYRLTNRPDNDNNMIWYEGETTVSGSTYRTLYVGQTLYRSSSNFMY